MAFSCSDVLLRNHFFKSILPVSAGDVLNTFSTVCHRCEYDHGADVHCLYIAVVFLTDECLHCIFALHYIACACSSISLLAASHLKRTFTYVICIKWKRDSNKINLICTQVQQNICINRR